MYVSIGGEDCGRKRRREAVDVDGGRRQPIPKFIVGRGSILRIDHPETWWEFGQVGFG